MPTISKPRINQVNGTSEHKKTVPNATSCSAASLSADPLQRIMSLITETQLEHVNITDLKVSSTNAKRHPPKQVKMIAENIRAFGFTNPLLIDEHNNIIAGHGRYAAALQLRLPEVPAIRLSHLTSREKRGLSLADNKLAELGTWDVDILAAELREITDVSVDISFDAEILGFDLDALDRRGETTPRRKRSDRADQIPSCDGRGGPITQPGDLWICGDHRVVCGDPFEEATYSSLLGVNDAHVVFADGSKFASSRGLRRGMGMTSLLIAACKLMASRLTSGGVMFMSAGPQHLGDILDAVRPILGNPKDVVVSLHSGGEPGTFYRSAHQLFLVFSAGDAGRAALCGAASHRMSGNLRRGSPEIKMTGASEVCPLPWRPQACVTAPTGATSCSIHSAAAARR
jgi:hypothetical protein